MTTIQTNLSRSIRLAILQDRAVPCDPSLNIAAIDKAARIAAEAGADLLITPELFVTGYAPPELSGWMTPARIRPLAAEISTMARHRGIAIVASMPDAVDGGDPEHPSFAIASIAWDATGEELFRYHKVHLFGPDEKAAFVPGVRVPEVVDWKGLGLSTVICYDVEFPEAVRNLALRGAQLVAVPTAITTEDGYIPRILVPARAAENNLVVGYANHAGEEGGLVFGGNSVIAGPVGREFARAGAGPALIIVDVEVGARIDGSPDYLGELRADIFRV